MTWYQYLYTQCWAIARYLRLAAWPNALSIDYGYRTIHGGRGIAGAVLLGALGVATILAWTRASRYGWFAFLGSMFFMILAPSSSVVPVLLEIAAERRFYLALAVVLVLGQRRRGGCGVYSSGALRRSRSPRWPSARPAGSSSRCRLRQWREAALIPDPVALWSSAVDAVPENSRALGQLGWALFREPNPDLAGAESTFVRAIAQDSACPGKCLEYGTLLSNEGRFAEAAPLLERHLAWEQRNILAARLLAYDYMKLGQFDRAIPYLAGIAEQTPKESYFVMLGVAYLSSGRRDEAISTFRHMAGFDPGSAELQRLSQRLEDGASHPEALPNLQEFAFWVWDGSGWGGAQPLAVPAGRVRDGKGTPNHAFLRLWRG